MQTLDHNLQLRMDLRELRKFKKKCGKLHRNHSDLLREIITAFNEDRLQIAKPEGDNLYVD